MKFIVEGEPKGKARARVTKFATYTPDSTVLYENLVKLSFQQSKPRDYIVSENYISMTIIAYFKIPKATSKIKKKLMLENKLRPDKKPDIDNIVKIICDALNEIAYRDDKQIIDLRIMKYYSENPKVEVMLNEIM